MLAIRRLRLKTVALGLAAGALAVSTPAGEFVSLSLSTFFANAQGFTIRVDEDVELDGDLDTVTTYERDPEGRLLVRTRDDLHSQWDMVETITRSPEGRPLTSETDQDGDGLVDVRRSYSYDDLGRLARLEVDRPADGGPGDRTTYRYDCE